MAQLTRTNRPVNIISKYITGLANKKVYEKSFQIKTMSTKV